MNKKRAVSYALLLSLFVVAVVFKVHLVVKERNREVVTIPAIWSESGKPVVTMKVERGPVDQFSAVVASPLASGGYICYVPADQKRLLAKGQEVASIGGVGQVLDVGEEVDIATGLYPVHLQLPAQGVAEVKTETFVDALFIPKETVYLDGDAHFVWVVQADRVKRREVILGRRTRGLVEITEGLENGEVLVLEGGSLLKEGDRIHD